MSSWVWSLGLLVSVVVALILLNGYERKKMFKATLALAESGDADSQLELAKLYHAGRGVKKNHALALEWCQKAAECGDAKAQYYLSFLYHSGEDADYSKSAEWALKAAEQGDAGAQYMIGVSYYGGLGLTKDYAEAVKWLLRAAEQNDKRAQCFLGSLYFTGGGATKDYTEAEKWLQKSAAQGYTQAQGELELLYEEKRKTQHTAHWDAVALEDDKHIKNKTFSDYVLRDNRELTKGSLEVECKFCAEKIKAKAIICKHCGKSTTEDAGKAAKDAKAVKDDVNTIKWLVALGLWRN